jgi:hypothetical protein
MPFTTSVMATLVERLRIKAGISDTDSRFRVPAISLRDTQSTNTTSSTVEVKDGSLVLVGDTSGTDTITLGATDDLDDVVTGIANASTGVEAHVVAPDASEPAGNLLVTPPVSILGETVVLYAFSTALLEQLLDEALARAEGLARTRLFDDGTDITATIWRDTPTLHLDDRHVRYVTFFGIDDEEAFTATYTGAGTATIEVDDDAVRLITRQPSNAPVVTDIDLSDDADVSDVVSSINAISGWSATTRNDGRSDTLVRMPPERVTSDPVAVDRWVEADGEYRLDPKAGVIHMDELVLDRAYRGHRTSGQVRAHYRAGFDTLPADLEGLVLNAAKAGLDAMRQTGGVQSERLGDYSYTLATDTNALSAIEDAITAQRATLARYGRMLP